MLRAFRHILTIVTIFTIGFGVAGAQVRRQVALSVSFQDLRGKDASQAYVMAVIRARKDLQPMAANEELPKRLLQLANDWSIDVYRERYPEESPEKFETMRRKGISLTENSSFVMILDRREPTKVLGTLWTAYPDQTGKIELEYALNWNYPKSPPVAGPYPMLQSARAESLQYRDEMRAGVVEFKRLILDPASPRELMPMMLVRGEARDRLNAQKMSYQYGGRVEGVLPAEYALHCARKLVPIYLRFGFELVRDHPINGDYVMSIDRSNYVANAQKWISKAAQNGWSFSQSGDVARSATIAAQVQSKLTLETKIRSCRNVFQ